MNAITQFLFILSNGLLIPVIVLLCGGFLLSLLLLGCFLRSFAARGSFTTQTDALILEPAPCSNSDAWAKQFQGYPFLHKFMSRVMLSGGSEVLLHKTLADFEIQGDKHLQWPRVLLRVGPMLGLMGTLIPMGPALLGLAQGDISSMALNMQVAFSTTVIGIMVGAIGFFLNLAYGRWMKEDYYTLEYAANSLLHQSDNLKASRSRGDSVNGQNGQPLKAVQPKNMPSGLTRGARPSQRQADHVN